MREDNFSVILKKLRNQKGFTQSELSEALGVSQQTIAHIESNYRKPSYELILRIACYFDVSIDYLFGRTDNPEINK